MAGTPYNWAIDVGSGFPLPDGTLAAYVPSIDGVPAYYVAVAAYSSNGTESSLSSELSVGEVNPCAIDRCAADRPPLRRRDGGQRVACWVANADLATDAPAGLAAVGTGEGS